LLSFIYGHRQWADWKETSSSTVWTWWQRSSWWQLLWVAVKGIMVAGALLTSFALSGHSKVNSHLCDWNTSALWSWPFP
jgi:hypothetical protein